MSVKGWLQPGYRLLVMFFAFTSVLVAALGWMSWQLVQQDRALAGRRAEERRETAADLAAAALQKNLSQTEAQLMRLSTLLAPEIQTQAARYAASLSPGSALLVFSASGIQAFPADRPLFYPNAPTLPATSPAVFQAADELELRQQDHEKAAEALRPLLRHADPAIRAEALARLGRNLWKAGWESEALRAYDDLQRAGAISIAGLANLPAELVAREARLLIFERRKDAAAAAREASALLSALKTGGWRISRASFEFYSLEACRGLGVAAQAGCSPPAEAVALSAAAEAMWHEWQAFAGGEANGAGRRVFADENQSVLLLWRGSAERLTAIALGRAQIESQWLAPVQAKLAELDARIMLADAEGRPVLGARPRPGTPQSILLASATQLPWTLHAISIDRQPANALGARPLILTGLLTLFLLVLGGSYFIARAAAREVAVARQESDFVASVSHEFRTPITALRQLSELLVSGRVASDEDRNEYYRALMRESERLHRLVEGLLNFGRLEAGATEFRFEPLDVCGFLHSVVEEFQPEAEARGYRVELLTNGSQPQVRGDRAALGCVVWNLLENAVKYSPGCMTVWVELARDGGRIAIHVRDRGIGIPENEQKAIFRKFVRGAAVKTGSYRGAGVGLAMARQIITAHAGEIVLKSRPGEGSTFTVLLPEVE